MGPGRAPKAASPLSPCADTERPGGGGGRAAVHRGQGQAGDPTFCEGCQDGSSWPGRWHTTAAATAQEASCACATATAGTIHTWTVTTAHVSRPMRGTGTGAMDERPRIGPASAAQGLRGAAETEQARHLLACRRRRGVLGSGRGSVVAALLLPLAAHLMLQAALPSTKSRGVHYPGGSGAQGRQPAEGGRGRG